MKEVQDHFFKLAKEEGYRARSAYKLLEIQERFHLLKAGSRVLDCGACPGSWLQVAAKIVGQHGLVVGVDLKPIERRGFPSHVMLMEGDLRDLTVEDLPQRARGRLFDSIISDMGPDTSGVPSADSSRSVHLCNALLDKLPDLLRLGGHCVMKVYEGGEYPALLKRMKSLFDDVRGFKPKASRDESVEMYVVGQRYLGPKPEKLEPVDPKIAKGKPSTGWGKPTD